ncbi:MAG: hypothetical protein E7463_00955 [Ruminococcaceae bacterium]|nr:hypothetical protein [Oscillospiraceae bacterium]
MTTTTAATTADPASTHAVLPDSEEFMYVAEHGAAPEWMRGNSFAVAGNGRFWQYMTNAQSDDPTPFIGSIRAEGNFFERHPYIFEDQHILSALAPIPGEQNCLWFVESVFIPDGRTYESHILVRVNADGEAVVSDDVTSIIDEREISRSVGTALPDGRYFLCVEELVCLFDGAGELIFKTTVDQHTGYPEATLTSSGEIALLIDANGARKLYLVDETAQKLKPVGTVNDGYSEIHLAEGDEFFDLYLFGESLWGYHLATGEKTKIVAFSDFGMQPDNIVRILPVGISETGAPKFACYEIYGSQVSPTLLEQRIKEPEKITLTLGTIRCDTNISNAVSEFNRTCIDYQIEIIEYATEEDPTGMTNFSVSISTGNIPDLLDIANLQDYSLIQKKLLRDLTPFIESDPDLSPGLFLPNIFEVMKHPDGAIYYMAPGFRVSTMYTLYSKVGKLPATTFSEALVMMENNPNISRPISNCVREQLPVYYPYIIGQFVDWYNLKATFDNEEFLACLELIRRIPKITIDDNENKTESFADGSSLFAYAKSVSMMEFMDLYERFGDDLQATGIPGQGSTVFFHDKLAVTSHCMHPEGAWEFIRSYILDIDGEDIKLMLPVLKYEYQDYLDRWRNYYDANSDHLGGEKVQYKPSEDVFTSFDAIIRGAKTEEKYDYYIFPILDEEIEAFLDGIRSAEETAEVIQSRVALVLAEMQ